VRALDEAHPAILSNDTEVRMVLLLDSSKFWNAAQTLDYYNGIVPGTVTTSQFQFRNRTCTIQDDGRGALNIMTLSNDINATVLEVGRVDYAAGTISVNSFEIEKIFGYGVRVYAESAIKNISAVQNVLLNVDVREVNLTAVPTKK
jgi:hypothetical protein